MDQSTKQAVKSQKNLKSKKRKGKKAYKEWIKLRRRNLYRRADGSVAHVPSHSTIHHDHSFILEDPTILEEEEEEEEEMKDGIDYDQVNLQELESKLSLF